MITRITRAHIVATAVVPIIALAGVVTATPALADPAATVSVTDSGTGAAATEVSQNDPMSVDPEFDSPHADEFNNMTERSIQRSLEMGAKGALLAGGAGLAIGCLLGLPFLLIGCPIGAIIGGAAGGIAGGIMSYQEGLRLGEMEGAGVDPGNSVPVL